jgi:8-oxo-dGTP pyrophosphatase MutT (NUDIX family)
MVSPGSPLNIADLRAALRRPLPGLPAQMRMAPQPRPGTERILDPSLDCRRAGVLVLLYPCGGELSLVLTRRTESVENHRGQISFPGGSLEPGETTRQAALREAEEELGVSPTRLELLGELSPLYVPPSNFCIYPTAAYAPNRPDFVPLLQEVAEVIEVPLVHLLDPATRREEVWQLHGLPVHVPFYTVGPHKVWGATAMILSELLAIFRADATCGGRTRVNEMSSLRQAQGDG